MPWVSPIDVDATKNNGRKVVDLLKSSPESWRSTSMDVMPRIDSAGHSAFTAEGDRGASTLGVSVEGQFQLFFADKENPLVAASKTEKPAADADKDKKPEDKKPEGSKSDAGVIGSIIDKSPESARLFVFGSNTFLSDQTLGMIGSAEGTVYGNAAADRQCSGLVAGRSDAAGDPFTRTFQPHAAAARGITAHVARVLELRHRAGAARTDLRHPPLARQNARREVPHVARFQDVGEKSFDASKGEPA